MGREQVCRTRGHDAAVFAVQFVGGGKIASASGDERVRIWDIASGEERGVLAGHKGRVLSLSRHRELLASGGMDGGIRLWGTRDGRSIMAVREGEEDGESGAVASLEFNQEGTLLAGGVYGGEGGVEIWRVADG